MEYMPTKMENLIGCPVSGEDDLISSKYDGIILVSWPGAPEVTDISSVLSKAIELDPGLLTETAVIPLPDCPAGKLIHSPTGPIDPDYDDIRIFKEAGAKGMDRAIKAGVKRPVLVLRQHPDEKFYDSETVTLLGALQELYVPLEVRERNPTKTTKIDYLGVWSPDCVARSSYLASLGQKLESGLCVARDIGGGDPERMAPPNVLKYVQDIFANSCIKVTVIQDLEEISKEYPLFEAANRAASVIERHRGCIIFLEYNPPERRRICKTVYLVGKGVTYGTGGVMAGMSRDKCGAAAVAGFMQLVKEFKPKDVKIVAAMCMVINSVGENCYAADEVIVCRSGRRVRMGNTDAEGSMVMADVLCKMKEMALNAKNPKNAKHLYTIATLAGHAYLSAGDYGIIIDNGPARKDLHDSLFQDRGDVLGDIFEISVLRKDDIASHRGKAQGDDLQANNLPSSRTERGHQGPVGFLLLASGLDNHGTGSERPLQYTHLDIAGAAGDFPYYPSGAGVLALGNMFILKGNTYNHYTDYYNDYCNRLLQNVQRYLGHTYKGVRQPT